MKYNVIFMVLTFRKICLFIIR